MPAPDVIHQLVKKFQLNRDAYRSGSYNEAQLRVEFLDPFFEALGWDIYNKKGFAPDYRDVVVEDSLKIGDTSKSPDYAFKIGIQRKFIVEAKKPAVDIAGDIHPAYQLRRYAWNAHLPLSVLTDFEEFAIYNCKNKPNPNDRAATAREKIYKYTEYIEKWDEIADIFSRDAVWKGNFDRYAETSKGKKGTTRVDDAFLADIENWRLLLARNIALRNPHIANERQLNYAVQMTIDRIIFLRICEDRGVEGEEQLKQLMDQPDIYVQLVEVFRRADLKYNSGLFHFNQEKENNSPVDTFTPDLMIDDKVLKEIIKSIYYPCPYIFKEIPIEILGQVYEQFLGKVIRLTPGHRAKVEEKPEVRKAGGVYYTPRYIVDYIVKNTVGKLLDGKTPNQAVSLTIVDPACGSGSFLLGAYQYLLNWHLEWYSEHNPEKWCRGKNPALVPASGGGYKLTTEKRKSILVNNIYGVDIDAQAVEVTKLSLLLKVLEGESGQLSLGFERVLPDLSKNIQCGNSLIDEDYFAGRLIVEPEERRRVNPFGWRRAFPQVFARGGFDALIGNPPYIRIQAMKEWAPTEVEFYKKIYKSANSGNYDVYVVFIEKAFSLLNKQGKLGFILPHKFFQAQFGKNIRLFLSERQAIDEIIHFGAEQIFRNATTYTCLLFLSAIPSTQFRYVSINDLEIPEILFKAISKKVHNDKYDEAIIPMPEANTEEWNFFTGKQRIVFTKLRRQQKKLSDITQKIFVGLQTSADKIYVLKLLEANDTTIRCYSKALDSEVEIEAGLVKPFLMGKDVHRYDSIKANNVVIFPYILNNGKAKIMSPEYIQKKFPKGWQYLLSNKHPLQDREHGKMKVKNFYAYIYPKNLTEFDSIKIMTPDIALGCQLTIDREGMNYHTTTIYSFKFLHNQRESPLFFLGVLNSQILWFFLKTTGNILRGGYFRFKTAYLKPFPIRTIDFNDPVDVHRHDRMVALVERMLALHKRKPLTPQEKTNLAREIEATDRQIDALVYELYDLTEEEIKIIEGE